MAIEIVDLPLKMVDLSIVFGSLPEGTIGSSMLFTRHLLVGSFNPSEKY